MKKRKSTRKRAKRVNSTQQERRDKGLSSGAKSRPVVTKLAAPPVSTEEQACPHRFHIQETLSRFAKLL